MTPRIPIFLATIILILCLAAQITYAQTIETMPPVVVKTVPEAGRTDVAPGITEIQVTFSKDMADGSWSWTQPWPDANPTALDKPKYADDHKTCTLKVLLEPNKTYAYWLNSAKFQNFKDRQGHPAVPYLLVFQTSAPVASTQATTSPATQHVSRLQFRFVRPAQGDLSPVDEFADPTNPGRKLQVLREVLLDESALSSAKLDPTASNADNPTVELAFTEAGAKLFGKITSDHVHQQLAIVLDGRLLMAPTIHSAITCGLCMISFGRSTTNEEAAKLAATLNAIASREAPSAAAATAPGSGTASRPAATAPGQVTFDVHDGKVRIVGADFGTLEASRIEITPAVPAARSASTTTPGTAPAH
jgi:hypothetical protein